MDQFFTEVEQPQQQVVPQEFSYNPPVFQEPVQLTNEPNYNSNQFNYTYEAPVEQNNDNQNEFNEFQEDETTRRIREEEQRIQNLLKTKSERQWEDKQKRREEGKHQLEDFFARKEQEKQTRAQENKRKQAERREELSKLNLEAGWKKVISSINVRSGEHKGSKDTGRMREAILHRREDDKR